MAFDVSKLTPHDAASKGTKIWSYDSGADAAATVIASGYFDNHHMAFTAGDIVICSCSDQTIAVEIAAITSGVVTVQSTNLGGGGTVGTTTKAGGTLAVPITARFVTMTTGGVEALTLADGVPGQMLTMTLGTDGGDGTLTPATATGWATAVFADAGDTLTVQYVDDTVGWIIIGYYGVAAPPVLTV